MAYLATNIFDADGVRTYWDFSFAGVHPDAESGTAPYLYPEDVKALELYKDIEGNAASAVRLVTIDPALPTRANIVGAPVAAGRKIKIFRQTEIRYPLVDYRDRQTVSEVDLDLANRQAIFVAQETQDVAGNNMTLDKNDNYDVLGRRIVNLAPGVDLTDAVNVSQLNRTVRGPATEGSLTALPGSAARANKVLTFDASGNPAVAVLSGESAAGLAVLLADNVNPANGAGKIGYSGGTVASALDALGDGTDALKGAAKVGYKGRTVAARLSEQPSPMDFLAVGNGTTDDTAAFTALEAATAGKVIDLGGRSYAVTAVPTKNKYVNGTFKVGGYSRVATPVVPPHFHTFGGQLRKLKADLDDPLMGFVGIVAAGDSITWGVGTGESGPTSPYTALLTDIRDLFGPGSWVNNFKRYIGRAYCKDLPPLLSNWPTSVGGESIATYSREHYLFPGLTASSRLFTVRSAGVNINEDVVQRAGARGTKAIRVLASADVSVESSHSITFTTTGYGFSVEFEAQGPTATYYEVLVNGISQGTFSMIPGAIATSGPIPEASANNYWRHDFGSFLRDAVVVIKTRRMGVPGLREMRIQSIRINKQIRISNQGISGVATDYYRNFLLGAFSADDSHVIFQLGSNDRIIRPQAAGGPEPFRDNLNLLLSAIPANLLANTTLMVANDALSTNTAVYSMDMQEIRGVVHSVARARSLDFVDNFSALLPYSMSAVTGDNLHPNVFGHALIANNLISALESA